MTTDCMDEVFLKTERIGFQKNFMSKSKLTEHKRTLTEPLFDGLKFFKIRNKLDFNR